MRAKSGEKKRMGRPAYTPCGCDCGCGLKSDPIAYDDHSMTDLCVRCGRWANDPEGQPLCQRESVCVVCGDDRLKYDWDEFDWAYRCCECEVMRGGVK